MNIGKIQNFTLSMMTNAVFFSNVDVIIFASKRKYINDKFGQKLCDKGNMTSGILYWRHIGIFYAAYNMPNIIWV